MPTRITKQSIKKVCFIGFAVGGTDEVMVGGRSINAGAYVSRFNFGGADQEKKCGVLSGGERNRLPPCLNIEGQKPTFYCSMGQPTISTLIHCARWRKVSSFAGCAVVISHDRWFPLDHVSQPIFWLSREIRGSISSKEAIRNMRKIKRNDSATLRRTVSDIKVGLICRPTYV